MNTYLIENLPDPYVVFYWDYQQFCYYKDICKHRELTEFFAQRMDAWEKVLGFKMIRKELRGTIYDRGLIRNVTERLHHTTSPFTGFLESNDKIQKIYDTHNEALESTRAAYQDELVRLVVGVIKNEYPQGLGVTVNRQLLVDNGYGLYKPDFYD